MDNKQQQPAQPVQPPPAQPAAATPPPPGGSNKLLLAILGLALLIVIAGGIYLYVNQKGAKNTPSTTAKPSTAPQTVDVLEKDLNATSLDDLEKEFSTVDSDLKGL